jgi:hypothetical protein
MSIEKLRRGWNDATRARAAAGGRAGAACVPGRNRKGFTTSFLMRRDSISAEALQLRRRCPFPFRLLAYLRIPI